MKIRKVEQGRAKTYIHTHDSITFKRCRRKWDFTSPVRMHLQPVPSKTEVNPHFWFGSGFHAALEDYHGYNKFGSPTKAFDAYVAAHIPEEKPEGWEALQDKAHAMFEMYLLYLDQYKDNGGKPYKVVTIDGVPQVEVDFALVFEDIEYYTHNITGENVQKHLDGYFYTVDRDTGELEVVTDDLVTAHEFSFGGTLDAVVEDEHGDWWIQDYKTAKVIDREKLPMDQQISNYVWAASLWYDRPIAGMLYTQITKDPPRPPKITSKGVSTDKRQRTTALLYQLTCMEYYGSMMKVPKAQLSLLDMLIEKEQLEGSKFISMDWVERTEEHQHQTYENIVNEILDMTRPDLYIYPNPTKDCSWDCNFRTVCIAMNDGADWKWLLEDVYEKRSEVLTEDWKPWQRRMFKQNPELFPDEVAAMTEQNEFDYLLEGDN